ncbi:hypothetical protein UFOVP232_76 [uncultured Caudovirales phage]|jgi:hypothetical protein|uniref:Uncharacterized protein n=1 Tax=uncultured Caudovirales phage TaxID=2100421 RepID=A0A6J7WQ48_9CAUD|nr:hypothetical protein UFOVP232_76 [uncultured Caudovirales phage]
MTKENPNSPFLWKSRTEPSIFFKDPYFRAKKMSPEQAQNLNRMHNFTIRQQQAFGARNADSSIKKDS